MKEIPILFSTPMVQAILEGRKTQTRRLIKAMPGKQSEWLTSELLNKSPSIKMGQSHEANGYGDYGAQLEHPSGGPLGWVNCPYGKPGDLLWVRETWRGIKQDFGPDRIEYKATEAINLTEKWRPSIFMPKEAARMWLQVENVRVERLQDITPTDVLSEGVGEPFRSGAGSFMSSGIDHNRWCSKQIQTFKWLWQKINGADSWQANPWVWVVSFKVLSTTGKPNY